LENKKSSSGGKVLPKKKTTGKRKELEELARKASGAIKRWKKGLIGLKKKEILKIKEPRLLKSHHVYYYGSKTYWSLESVAREHKIDELKLIKAFREGAFLTRAIINGRSFIEKKDIPRLLAYLELLEKG
jgi:hypothetical protein